MKILISEDDDYKFEKIRRSVSNTIGGDCGIHRESSVVGTIKYLEANEVDILIQDMNLPMYDEHGTKVITASGLRVIYHVHYDEIPIKHKFVCSYDSDVKEKYGTEFNECGFKFVHFNPIMSLSGAFSIFEGE